MAHFPYWCNIEAQFCGSAKCASHNSLAFAGPAAAPPAIARDKTSQKVIAQALGCQRLVDLFDATLFFAFKYYGFFFFSIFEMLHFTRTAVGLLRIYRTSSFK